MCIDWYSGSVTTVAGRPIRVWRYMGARVRAHNGRLRTGQKPQEDKNGVAKGAYQVRISDLFLAQKKSLVFIEDSGVPVQPRHKTELVDFSRGRHSIATTGCSEACIVIDLRQNISCKALSPRP